MGIGFSLTGIKDMTEEEAIDYFKGLPGFEDISGQIRERTLGFDPVALAEAHRRRKEKDKKELTASVTEILSAEQESALKAKEAQKERGVKPRGFFGTVDLSREGQEAIGEEARIRQEKGFKLDPLERDIEVSDYKGPLSPFQMLAAESEIANYFTGKTTNWLDEISDKYTFGMGSKALRAIPHVNLPFLYTDLVKPSEKTEDILFGEKGKDLNWEEKARALAGVNEERPFHEELLTGLFAPTSIVTMPIVGTSKSVTKTAQHATDLSVFKTIIDNVPLALANKPDVAQKLKIVKSDIINKVINREIKLPNMPEGSFFENDLRFWINMPENEPINIAKYTARIAKTHGTEGVLHLTETNGTLQRLLDVGLVVKNNEGNYVKSVMSGDPKAIELLGNWGRQIGIEGASDANFFVADIPTFKNVKNLIVTSENPIVKAFAKHSGINPSVAATTEAEKTVITYGRISSIADDLTEVALQAGLDTHGSRFGIIKGKHPITIDSDGIVKGTGTHWLDVFSDPDAFIDDLSTAARAYIEDYKRIVDEVEKLRLKHGLKPLTKDRNGYYYIPRTVTDIANIELLSKSDSHMKRTYDTATEARMGKWNDDAGDFIDEVKYEISPRANLKLHIKSAYHEILQEELGKELLETGTIVSLKDVVLETSPKIATRFNNAKEAYLAARETLKRIRSEQPSAYTATAKADLAKRIDAAEAANNAAWRELKSSTKAYNNKLKALRARDKLSGKFWGDSDPSSIDVKFWRGNFYKDADYEVLNDGIEKLMGTGSGVFHGLGTAVNTSRWLQSNADWGAPFIHGLTTIGRNPKVWAKSMGYQMKAFLMPNTQAAFVKDNIKTFHEMAQHGVPVGDVEMFAAMQRGQGLSPGAILTLLPDERGGKIFGHMIGDDLANPSANELRNLDKIIVAAGAKGARLRSGTQEAVNQTLGRFQSSYSMFLAMNRALLWQSMSPWWTQSKRAGNTLDELGAYIRNMTGGLDTKALGVSSSQRSIEGMWLAFSPRLLRSTIALVYDGLSFIPAEGRRLLRPNQPVEVGATMRQKEAARSLALTLTAVHGLYTAAVVSSGLAKGHDRDRILHDFTTGINPLNGKRYLSIEVDGQWYGVGGQVRALTQLLAAMVSTIAPGGAPIEELGKEGLDPRKGWNLDEDNPILKFLSFRGSVAQEWARAIAEGVTGGEIDALMYDNVDGPLDAIHHIGESSLPFVVQGMLEGDSVPGWIIGATGIRTSPMSGSDEAAALIKDAFFAMSSEELAKYGHEAGDVYKMFSTKQYPANWKRDLNKELLSIFKENNPAIQEALDRHQEETLESGQAYSEYREEKDTARNDRDNRILEGLATWGIGAKFRDIMQAQFKEYGDTSEDIDRDHADLLANFEDMDASVNGYNFALEEYWRVMAEHQIPGHPPIIDPITLRYNFDEHERRLESLADNEDVAPHLQTIESQKYQTATPEIASLRKEYDQDLDVLREYWDIQDEVIESFAFEDKWEFITSDPDVATEETSKFDKPVPSLDWDAADISRLDAIKSQIIKQQKDERKKDPILDLLLFKWGFTRNLVNSIAILKAHSIRSKYPDYMIDKNNRRADLNEEIMALIESGRYKGSIDYSGLRYE